MKTLENSFAVEVSDVAAYRLHILNHFYKYGREATLDAFKVKQSTLYDWKRAYETSGKRVISLVPKSTAPQHVRVMETDWRLMEFIKQMRKEHGNIGKSMLKPFVDAYAKEKEISTIGETTIGKIIKRRRFTFEEKVYPQKQANRFKKLRTRKSPKVTTPGFIQMDSVVVYINYEKHLFMCVLDIFTKFAHVVNVENLLSATAARVFKEFQKLNPTPIHTMQTDNGSEFLKSFHAYLEEEHIKHQFIYPRMPKINAYIERFNRTIQEEFIMRNDEIFYDQKAFAQKLTNYLYWYNYQRPHASLKYVSPMTFIQTKLPKST
ncbi:MAG: integrase core domain-containing protein [Rhabdochlamydiaceae bacterium]